MINNRANQLDYDGAEEISEALFHLSEKLSCALRSKIFNEIVDVVILPSTIFCFHINMTSVEDQEPSKIYYRWTNPRMMDGFKSQ